MDFNNKWPMKRIVIYLLATVLIAYGLGAIIMFSSPKSIFNSSKTNYTYNINDEKTAQINGINQIKINVASTDINIIPSDETEVKAHLYGNVVSSSGYSKPELECYTSGNTLYINVKNKTTVSIGFFSSSIKLDVNIPSSYSDTLALTTSSGNIDAKGLKLKELDCTASSGDTNINTISADKFLYNSTSGNLRADELTTKSTNLKSSSGDNTINNFIGDLTCTAHSGNIRVQFSSFNNNIDASASSGDIQIKLPETSEFYLNASASSGDINADFPITTNGNKNKHEHELTGTVGSDKNKVRIKTSSGNINIFKN